MATVQFASSPSFQFRKCSACWFCSTIRDLSLIGSSLGGLYSRYAIERLFRSLPEHRAISGRVFVTLATPHLGVRGMYTASGQTVCVCVCVCLSVYVIYLYISCVCPTDSPFVLCAVQFMTWIKSGSEMMMADNRAPDQCLLCRLAQTPYLTALTQFTHRLSYAPLFDDGIVNHCSAALEVE